MINILHTIDTAGPGGAETVFLNLVKGLERDNVNSTVAIPGKGWVYDELVINGFNPIFLSSSGSFSFRYLFQIIIIIKRYRINLIQSHLIGSNVYCSLAGMLCRVPVISTFHGFVDMDKGDKLFKMRFFIINQGSKKIVFVSERLKEYFIKEYNILPDKAITIYNGIDLQAYQKGKEYILRKELGLDSGHILIGSIGNIREAKGYDYLLKAAAIVIKKHPNSRFVIAGEGSGPLFNKLLELRTALALDEKVYFLGFRNDVPDVLNSLYVFVLPSTSEGFSIVTLEAMACKIPIVVTKSGGPEEVMSDTCGLLVTSCNEKELADAIIKVVENDTMKKEFTRNAYNIINKKFNLNVMIDEYAKIYKLYDK